MTLEPPLSNALRRKTGEIKLHGPEGFAGMRRAGRLVAEALDMLHAHVRPGVTTAAIDRLVFEFAADHGVMPATLGYRGYRYASCISVNHVVCHGMPEAKPLREGDIANVDVTLIVEGWHGDSSRMYEVGAVSRRAARLVETTLECLDRGVDAVRPGARLSDIGAAIEAVARRERYSVVTDFCGHGLGQLFHDEPNVLHYRWRRPELEGPAQRLENDRKDPVLRPGMIFTVEPMINCGRPHVKVLSDGWTAVTRDRDLSAQFEHTVGVTETGVEVFTRSPAGLDRPAVPA